MERKMTILRTTPGFNPFIIEVGKSTYTIKRINFFNENGVLFTNTSGWFGNNNELKFMMIPVEIKKKLKPVFNKDEAFIISFGKDLYTNRLECELYIHYNLMNFFVSEKRVKEGYSFLVYDVYFSSKYGVTVTVYRNTEIDEETKTKVDEIKARISELDKEKEVLEKRLYNEFGC
jgi:hypothetical protein